MNFWNGNKSTARQNYELKVLQCILATHQDTFSTATIHNDLTDYPKAIDEANVFDQGCDVLVTVAGNTKFSHKNKIVIPLPIAKGLLGYRLLIIKKEQLPKFALIKSAATLQEMTIGIPDTWADADLFRSNNYNVVEKGSFDTLFNRLNNNEFDYVSLGVNEIEQAFNARSELLEDLIIEPSLIIYYPFPLVFYVNANKKVLANRIQQGLDKITKNGELDKIFSEYYGDIVDRLCLKKRTIITLNNPILPASMKNFSGNLLE